ncbi:uncharacterized protein [Chironomus tepperi]|uniref:uncharacterized protein n=1 Tax=Chironomus tepperi TaxID=113505 RepID=UPI00391F86F5
MKIKSFVVIFLSLASIATSQSVFNITAYDGQLRDIFNGLTETETRIGRLLSNLSDFVGKINGNLRMNKSRLGLELSHLQLDLQLQGSINSYETYNRLTGCSNAASKISEIDIDLMKFGDFVDRLELNMTELYHRNLHVTYDYMLSIKQVNVTQQDILYIILGVNEAMIQYLYYIMQLQVNIQYEKSISTNLKLFLKHFCECDDNANGVASKTNSKPPLSVIEGSLIDRQARIIDAANATLIQAQMLSKNGTKNLKVMSQKLANFCLKMTRIDDYSNVTIPYSNSCLDLSKVQNFMTYRKFHYTQVLSFMMTNSSVLKFFKDSIINASKSEQVLNSNITSLNTSLYMLDVELAKYAVGLHYTITIASRLVYEYSMAMESFCGCSGRRTKNMTTTGMPTTSKEQLLTTTQKMGTQSTAVAVNMTTVAVNVTSLTTTTKNLMTTSGTATGSATATTGSAASTTGSAASTAANATTISATMPANTATSSMTSKPTNSTFSGSSTTSTSSISSTSPTSSTSRTSSTSPISSTSLTSSTSPTTSRIPPTLPPTVPPTTTKNPLPLSNSSCIFTKDLTDMSGNYIKSACLVDKVANGTYVNSICRDMSMQLMTVDSNMTRTALTIFVQETLSEGTFWISGGNGSEICNFADINGTGLSINQTECMWNSLYSICEYKDPSVPTKLSFEPDLDACGFVIPVATETDKDFTRYACVMAYTRSYVNSNYNCMLNGMKMFNAESKLVMETLNEYLVSFFGNSSGVILWIDGYSQAGSCAVLDGSKVPFAVGRGDCDQLNWSICEAPYDGSY